MNTKTARITVEIDQLFLEVGECFMFLLWVENTMCDLIALQEGGKKTIEQYNMAYGKASHPSDFATKRLKMKALTFTTIRDRFLKIWPQWKDIDTVRESIERVIILRNAFSHAQVQPFRNYLLYNPNPKSWGSINKYMKCGVCLNYFGKCNCSKIELSKPRCLKLDLMVVNGAYEDIRIVDCECLFPTAVDIGVAYRGIAWPNGLEGFVVAENRIGANL